ncbi:protein kinase domain-containing protein [Pirellulaceae bacterium SH449]
MSDSEINLSRLDSEEFGKEESASYHTNDSTAVVPANNARPSDEVGDVGTPEARLPNRFVGRYRIDRQLGAGGFGVVFLAHDTTLNRKVALKISKPSNAISEQLRTSLLTEARSAANLDHPNLVRIYDVDQWNSQTFIVMEYINGKSLAQVIAEHNVLPLKRINSLLVQTARALEALHANGIVHRDLKPANILVTAADHVKVADLGLAISDETPIDSRKQFAGTRQYMSPEQVLGELHRIDGRTDIWAFGVILYELLTLQSPFRSRDPSVVFSQILKGELPSPRQRRPDIPDRLEQICLRCLARRMSQRFQSARQLISELEAIDSEFELTHSIPTYRSEPLPEPRIESSPLSSDEFRGGDSKTSSPKIKPSEAELLKGMVPRGLRAFTATDSSYFQKLMPGPHDLDGRPVILNHWLDWILRGRLQNGVGVLYGPSGCGKSSFVRAALLPTLPDEIETFFFDFSTQNPNQQLLREIQNRFSEVQNAESLGQAFSLLRRNHSTNLNKLVFVFDHFERALISQRIDLEHEMVRVLRQCDGVALQALVLVRDEFWSEISQFMQLLDAPLSDGENASSYPAMSIAQSLKVLEALGRAHEVLPHYGTTLSQSQKDFCKLAIDGLSEGGTVLPVRIALLTELMRGHPWEAATIQTLGGIDGAIVRFLGDCFDSPASPMSRRSVAIPCKRILRLLLPADQTELKAYSKSYAELRELTGFNDKPIEFQQAIRCLEQDLKLISPIKGSDESREYTLVHDYLVRPIRTWLSETDQRTWVGRQKNLLAKKAERYKRDPSNDNLLNPVLWMTASLVWPKRELSKEQQLVIKKSTPRALFSFFLSTGLICVLVSMGVIISSRSKRLNEQTRNATYYSVFNYLNTKDDLESNFKTVSQNPGLAYSVIDDVRKNGDPGLQSRVTLLKARLNYPVSVSEIIKALNESVPTEWTQWKLVVADQNLRDELSSQLVPRDPVEIPPVLHWLFMDQGDFRLLHGWKEPLAAELPSQRLLAFLVSHAGFDPAERGLSLEDQVSLAEALATYSHKPTTDLPMVARVAMLLYGFKDSKKSQTFDWAAFAETYQNSPQRSIALTAQWLLSQLREQFEISEPSEKNGNWKLVRVADAQPFRMILIEKGELMYQHSSILSDSMNAERLVVPKPFWLAQTEVSETLVEAFFNDYPDLRNGWMRNTRVEKSAAGLNGLQWLKFCNWASEREGLEPCYHFSEVEGCEKTNFEGVWFNPKAIGFRLPNLNEMQLAAANGDVELSRSYSESQPYADRVAPASQRANVRNLWSILPDAWSFQGLYGNLFEMVMNDRNEFATSTMNLELKNSWESAITSNKPENFAISITGVRLAQSVLH